LTETGKLRRSRRRGEAVKGKLVQGIGLNRTVAEGVNKGNGLAAQTLHSGVNVATVVGTQSQARGTGDFWERFFTSPVDDNLWTEKLVWGHEGGRVQRRLHAGQNKSMRRFSGRVKGRGDHSVGNGGHVMGSQSMSTRRKKNALGGRKISRRN